MLSTLCGGYGPFCFLCSKRGYSADYRAISGIGDFDSGAIFGPDPVTVDKATIAQ
jgi:hypothetical protein